jgi:hypothetical protein
MDKKHDNDSTDYHRANEIANGGNDGNHGRREAKLDTTINQINELMDEPLFDPDSPSNVNNWYANLVKNDYDTAEALYAGLVITLGVISSQEALRMVKYGAAYVPFYGAGGSLF